MKRAALLLGLLSAGALAQAPRVLRPQQAPGLLVRPSWLVRAEGHGTGSTREAALQAAREAQGRAARLRLQAFLEAQAPGSGGWTAQAPLTYLDEGTPREGGGPGVVEIAAQGWMEVHPEGMTPGGHGLQVDLGLDRTRAVEGERIQIRVRGGRSFHARLLYLDAAGGLTQLLPNPYRPPKALEGGRDHLIPDGEDRFDLKVTPPFGTEWVVLHAATVPLGDLPLTVRGGVFGLSGTLEQAGKASRALRPQQAGGEDVVAFLELRVPLETSPRSR